MAPSLFAPLLLLFLLPFLLASFVPVAVADRSFTVDYDRNTFLKDGHPFRYISGTLHYFQIPHELWRDRMLRARALGINALQTYVMWSLHEPFEGRFDFTSSGANFTEYLALAKELGFVVIVRLGPYIDAEMDFGGFPYWLLKKPGLVLRSSEDDRYLSAVENWLTFLLVTVIKPNLYQNYGPIISVQLENEYGSYPACDGRYMVWLRDLARKNLGENILLFTNDAADAKTLNCSHVPEGVLATVDFGVGTRDEVVQRFNTLRQFLPKGPMVNSEFYPGWPDKWGNKKHATTDTLSITQSMQYMWQLNVTSFNIYPVHGGSNWGYSAGSESGPPFQGITTGYDFDAPISEAGDITEKFIDMRTAITYLTQNIPQDPIPQSPLKYAYGRQRLEWMGTVPDLVYALSAPETVITAEYPWTFEQLDQAYGFVLYETMIPKSSGRLQINGVRDRAYVIVDGQLTSIIQRQGPDSEKKNIVQLSKFLRHPSQFANVDDPSADQSTLHILVENQGRVCYGPNLSDPKGLVQNVTLNDQVLTNWTMYPIDLGRIWQVALDSNKKQELERSRKSQSPLDQSSKYIPSVYYGFFFAQPQAGDTFFDPSGWGKGQLYVNDKNIGRYWPQAGPQVTLYVPGVYLVQGDVFNQVYVLELDQPGECETDQKYGCWVQFTNQGKYSG